MDMKDLIIPSKSSGIKKLSFPWSLPFWSSLITLLIKRNQAINLHKFVFHLRDYFVKVWRNSFWLMKIAMDCVLVLVLGVDGDVSFALFW